MQFTRTPLTLTEDERITLQRWARRPKSSHALATRCKIILLEAEGWSYAKIGDKLDLRRQTVLKWRKRFIAKRLDGLQDEPRPGVKRSITDDRVEAVITRTLETKPPDATHWSTRSMAQAVGMSAGSVHRIWKAFGLQPHRVETFKLSSDPLFIEKVRDIVGLYMSPPENAIVLCVDEKSQVQALDRTQPLLPMIPGQAERRSHDYVRHGTTSLFAALDVQTGLVIGECHRRHRHQEFIKFLNTVDEVVQATAAEGTEIHLVLDNYATHKTPRVKRWLQQHPQYHVHFTPTSASWLNQVERVFAELTNKRLRRGVHRSVAALEKAIGEYLHHRNDDAKPFAWTADADLILGRVERHCQRISRTGH
jgi:transposase